MSNASPSISGGAVVSWSVTPSLPSNLSLDPTTGAISGTPLAIQTGTSYNVTATNSGGSDTTTIDITVNDVAPSGLSYGASPFTLTKDAAMAAASPTVSGGPVVSWSIIPSLPSSLSFDTSNGEISGTPRIDNPGRRLRQPSFWASASTLTSTSPDAPPRSPPSESIPVPRSPERIQTSFHSCRNRPSFLTMPVSVINDGNRRLNSWSIAPSSRNS